MSQAEQRRDVAVACRALAYVGCGGVIGGHVSVRSEGEQAFWINPVDLELAEVSEDRVVKVASSGEVLDGDGQPSIGVSFHADIYQARPDVNSIVHTHAEWLTLLAALRRPMRMLNLRSTYFSRGQLLVAPDDDLAGVARALGQASALLLPYHGGITAERNLGRAAALHLTLEQAAEIDLRLATGDTQVQGMSDEECAEVQKGMGDYLELTWEWMRRKGAVAA